MTFDTKWKRVNKHAPDKKYNISQSDSYQLFAYGHKYIREGQEEKELVLIYPKNATFTAPLKPFSFSPNMTVWVLPFEMGIKGDDEKLVLHDQMQLA